MKVIFDYKKLSKDILDKRVKEDLSFTAIFKQSGIPRHIVHGMEEGKQIPSCKNFALILGWLEALPESYFKVTKK